MNIPGIGFSNMINPTPAMPTYTGSPMAAPPLAQSTAQPSWMNRNFFARPWGQWRGINPVQDRMQALQQRAGMNPMFQNRLARRQAAIAPESMGYAGSAGGISTVGNY